MATKAKREVYQIRNDQVALRVISRIKSLEPDDEDPYQVIITKGKDVRSILQNSLYWKHIGEICQETGEDEADCHFRLKKKHLHPIYMRGTTKKNELYKINYNSLLVVHQAGIQEITIAGKKVRFDFDTMLAQVLTSTDATVKQFSEYINKYEREATQAGIYLTDPAQYMRGEID